MVAAETPSFGVIGHFRQQVRVSVLACLGAICKLVEI
jgi:hypothetical protein